MRDLFFVAMMSFLAIAVGYFLYAYGPESFNVLGRSSDTSFSVLYEGERAVGIDEPANYRITTTADLVQLWPLVYDAEGPGVPVVDFTKYEVLAIFDGTHSSRGYAVSVRNITKIDSKRTVNILHSKPGETCVVDAQITSPFQIIQIRKNDMPFAHTDTTSTKECT